MANYNLQDITDVFCAVCDTMNQRINEIGKIPTSDITIKNWHTYTNDDWEIILQAILELDKVYDVQPRLVKDAKMLQAHIASCDYLCDNVLYPTVPMTKQLPKRATEFTSYGRPLTVKTVTFSTMMKARELYCEIIGLDLPNDDSSKGKLDPPPGDSLFEF